MKHAGPAALDALEPLLAELRQRTALKERKRGIFYRKGRSFLHFHEDPAGLFADLACGATDGGGDLRVRVSTKAEQRILLDRVDAALPG